MHSVAAYLCRVGRLNLKAGRKRNNKFQSCALSVCRVDFERTAERARSFTHTHKTMPQARLFRIESLSVVSYRQQQPAVGCSKLNVDLCTRGMSRGVVDCFLENEKKLAPYIRPYFNVAIEVHSPKTKINLASCQKIAREMPHLLTQISEVIFIRVYCPDDLTHRIDQLARELSNARQIFTRGSVAPIEPSLSHLADQSDPGKVRANIIMQISGYSTSDLLELTKAFLF